MRRFLKPDATDENWEYYGKKCPYFGVVSWPKFREGMDETARAEFFQTGEDYVERIFQEIDGDVKAGFEPRRVLDFGCGVGRLLIPLARRIEAVTGVDVSRSMLAEAEKNCHEAGVQNFTLLNSLDEIALPSAQFDFVHSFIVFQHIRPDRGIPLFARLVDLLQDNGVGAIHMTFSSAAGKRDRVLHWLYRKIPLLFGAVQMARRKSFSEPLMDMAEYPLNPIFATLQDKGCHVCSVRFTRHSVRGMMLIFKKITLPEI